MNTQGLSRKMARFIRGLSWDEMPHSVVERAKDRLLDALAIAAAGRNSPYYPIGLELVKNSKGKATVLFHNLNLPAMDAAFLNAILIDSIGGTDTLMHAHPGGPIIATALALAEEEGRSGPDVLTAIVAGYDIMARISLAKETITPRFRGLSIFGPFGAAAAAGKIMNLDEDQMTSALGYAANTSCGLTECWIAGTMEAKFHAGLATRSGIGAALLARAGARAAETALEGKAGFYQAFAGTNEGLEAGIADLGQRFMILEAKYKPYPVCAENQIPVYLALKLRDQYGIDGRDIDSITETGPIYALNYPGVNYPGPFRSRVQAIMSAQFCNAAAFLGRPVFSPSFYDCHYGDPEIAEWTGKVKLVGEKDRKTTLMEVTLKNGKKHRLEGGEEELTPSFEKVKIKFQDLASDFWSKDQMNRITELVYHLDKARNLKALMNELKG